MTFTIEKPDIDESAISAPTPAELVERLSLEKSKVISNDNALIISADTVVVLNGEVLGKPKDKEDAIQMLLRLSSNIHEVYTGVTLREGSHIETFHEITKVQFRLLTKDEIVSYVDTGEPMDKAGSYGIQMFGALLVEGVHGDYFNVVGLPICRLGEKLKAFGRSLL